MHEGDGSEARPYVISDRNDLYGLAQESKTNNFAGKIIKLGADIVVNSGNANDWDEFAPEYDWTPIGQSKAFAGTFDGSDPKTGKIHTISGLYFKTTTKHSGLFGQIAGTDAKIQNLNLTNSYFESSQQNLGSIVGYANGGKLNTVKSDAIVVGTVENKALCTGGLIGFIYGGSSVTIDGCWFAGSVKGTYASGQRIGGFVGDLRQGTLTMNDCLYTGNVSSAVTSGYTFAAGFVGWIQSGTTANITDCLYAGTITVNNDCKEGAAFAGNIAGTLNITTSYVDTTKCNVATGWTSVAINVYDSNSELSTIAANTGNKILDIMKLSNGMTPTGTLLGFNFDTVWKAVPGKTPILKSFEK